MELGNLLEVNNRSEWRKWLRKNHNKENEIWLVYYKKNSGKQRIDYNDAVEEALCYGWIDSTQKTIDAQRSAQRFSPRRKNSSLSQLNRERIDSLIKRRRMTKTGLAAVAHLLTDHKDYKIYPEILTVLKNDKVIWSNFQVFPESYKRIRTAFVEGGLKHSKQEFQRRLNYLLKMTAQNKKFGLLK